MAVDILLEQAFRLQNQGDFARAEALYGQALQSVRDNPALWFNHGLVLRDLGRPQEALDSFEQAQRLSPPMAEIESERGNALRELGRGEEALAALNRALALRPGHAGVLINRGLALVALARLQEALADFDAALRLEPRLPLALLNRGATLEKLGRSQEALAAYAQALALAPDDPTALFQHGALLASLGRPQEALAQFDRALAAGPGQAGIRLGRAKALMALKRIEEAHEEMTALFAAHPDIAFVFDGVLETALHGCDFALRARLEAALPGHVRDGWPLAPLRLLQCCDDPALQREGAANYVKSQLRFAPPPLPPRRAAGGRRLKLAYLSHDFRNHAVAIFNAALMERHDRSGFELFAFSTGPDDGSAMRRRLAAAFEHFQDVRDAGDGAIADSIAAAGIDILVDLTGHTTGARPGVMARRPAPIQVNYQGWAGTTGNPFMDYMIADAIVAPPGSDRFFTEKLVRLPHCYHPTDPGRDAFAAAMTRRDAGLPENAFVFCAFNGVWKITPAVFAAWMTLLHQVPGSVLWLRHDNDLATRHLRQEAAAAGVATERLVFAGPAPEAEHLARHRLADLFLDTMPFPGHSTAMDALWAGLPVVTCSGASFAARVSASALHAAGLPELAAPSLADYQALALKLARDPALLAGFRTRLTGQRQNLKLFDLDGYRGALEAAYEKMAEISRAGLPPQAFAIPD